MLLGCMQMKWRTWLVLLLSEYYKSTLHHSIANKIHIANTVLLCGFLSPRMGTRIAEISFMLPTLITPMTALLMSRTVYDIHFY